jgi:hypothetical protein
MTEKMTYVKALEFAMSQLDSTVSKEVTDKLEALKAQLEKRAQYKSKSGKMTKTQVENMALKENILTVLEKPMTVTEIVKALALNEIGDYTPQKISALMRQLVLDEVVERITDKKRTLFSKVS